MFCRRSAGWLDALDRRGRIDLVSSRDDGVLDRMGLTEEDASTSVWVVAPGVRFSGAAAVAMAVSVALGTSLPLRLWRVPGFGRLAEWVYRLVARNRHRLVWPR